MKSKYLVIFFLIFVPVLLPEEFYLFDEGDEVDPSVFEDHKSNKFQLSYSLFPEEQKKLAVTFSKYFNNRTGFFLEAAQKERGSEFSEKSEFCGGLAYRFTKRSWTWVFTGNLGLSVNDDVTDLNNESKGFRLNHVTGRFSAEYIFRSGFGFNLSMTARMPIEFDLDDGMRPIHSLGILFQF
ncbi:MAG: hypothetical protein R6V47_02025 [Candidatus Delongbacteria bacterium]